ncbi:MAG: radical SAM family heme chaperone HemW [Candidatus Promineofilum sp.]|nr:radical SAM family heme chaperone HemW [Promineifilum sp.]
MTPYALYLHIPFCRQRCSYCDFNTYTTLNDLQPAYVAALAAEIRQVGALAAAAGEPRPAVRTVFFGGGTPSLLTPAQVGDLLGAARAAFTLDGDAEITMEANPGTVSAEWLAAVRGLGVNRLSFGVQSALPGELALLGRAHDFAAAGEAVDMATAAGFDNLNLDLIYGLPGQSVADWGQTLAAVLSLAESAPAITHISLYCLTIEPGTPMQRWLHNGTILAPDPDTAADQYELAGRELAAAGFGHYEISNWARPGRECRHNVVYWRNEPYLGLGAGAHGLAGGYRYQVVRQPRAYVRRMEERPPTAAATPGRRPPPRRRGGRQRSLAEAAGPGRFPLSAAVAAYHRVDATEAMSDTAITQLRLLDEGLDMAGFATRFGRPFDDVYANEVRQLEEWQLLHRRDGRLLLTERGRFLSNQVFYRFV